MKMKKLVALVTASALCLGMSMTAFAANSNTPGDADSNTNEGFNRVGPSVEFDTGEQDPANRGRYISARDLEEAEKDIQDKFIKDYKELYKDELSKGLISEEAVRELAILKATNEYNLIVDTFKDVNKAFAAANTDLKKQGYQIKDGATGVVIAAGDLVLKDEYGVPMTEENFPRDGIDRMIPVSALGDQNNELKAGDTVVVLHRTSNGVWEAQVVTVSDTDVNGQAYIKVHFDSLSPVAFVRLNSRGDLIKVDQAGNPIKDKDGNIQVVNKANTTNANAKAATTVVSGKSPKTGEF